MIKGLFSQLYYQLGDLWHVASPLWLWCLCGWPKGLPDIPFAKLSARCLAHSTGTRDVVLVRIMVRKEASES